ncbi:Arm DNA-binding domain-containing protein, partial [Enterobacter roggenkampii]|uniref:Arm DNA-binding domain-containing protein n=4 Tax=Enterobacteriaceae TaxID=543 RepID=UPI003BA14D06
MALTDIQIKRAKPQDKPYTLNDGQGLSLLINPDGSKGWRFRFRLAGKARLMSFGSYDLISLAEAREKREVAR